MAPSTPQSAFEPRSTIIRAEIAVRLPSLRPPTVTSVTCAETGFVARKSSARVNTSRTGRRSASAAPAASGSTSANLPPNAPPRGSAMTRIRSSGRPNAPASSLRVTNDPCVLVETTSVPPGSSHAVADLRLEVRLVDPGRPEGGRDDGVAGLERGGDVARAAMDLAEDVRGVASPRRRPPRRRRRSSASTRDRFPRTRRRSASRAAQRASLPARRRGPPRAGRTRRRPPPPRPRRRPRSPPRPSPPAARRRPPPPGRGAPRSGRCPCSRSGGLPL